MMTPLSRRDILANTLLGVAAAALLPRAAFAQAAGAMNAQKLSDNLTLITGAGGNVVAGVDGENIVLVDGGAKASAAALLDFVRKTTGKSQVAALFNTHWHPEQTGLNEALGADGVPIIAHENTRLWMTQTIEQPYADTVYPPMPEAGRPTETFYDKGSMPFAGGTADYSYVLQCHTDGDLMVHFPNENVIVAGGALATDRWANIDWWTGGWMGSGPARALNNVVIPTYGGMVGGLQKLLEIADDDTMIVGESGPAVKKAEIQAQFDMYSELADGMREAMYKALGPQEFVAQDPAKGMRPEWGSPEAFLVRGFESLWPHLTPDA